MPEGRKQPGIELSLVILCVCALGFSFWSIGVGWHNSIFDYHGFRQAQTAITAESILHGGPILHYETPVLGPPWSIPFEFPLYQGIAALIARLLSVPLNESGRFVSVFFYYLSFLPFAAILSGLGYRRIEILPALALFAASPFYIFLSRLFMIESTALFFSLMYVDQMLKVSRSLLGSRKLPVYIAGACISGMLAGLVKVTTFAPFFVLGSCLVLISLWNSRNMRPQRIKQAAAIGAFCLLLPVGVTALWTKFADHVKAQNPIGIGLTSTALKYWNFGTLTQRLNPRLYIQFFTSIHNLLGSILLLAVALLVAAWLCPRSLRAMAICFALYAGTIEAFFNLHLVHTYYAYANAIFFVAGVGLMLGRLAALPDRRAWFGVILLAGMLVACGHRYFFRFYPLQSWNAPGRPQASALIDATTNNRDVIVITGLQWSSEFPYQSHRRAIMDVPYPNPHRFDKAIANQGPSQIAALVACDDGRGAAITDALLQQLSLPKFTTLHADNCDIYERQRSRQ